MRDAGHKVRALRARPGGEQALLDLGAAEVIIGDASDRSVLRRAVRGIDTVYHIGPSAHPHEREMGFAIVDSARAAGVEHFIYSSVAHSLLSKLVQHKLKRDVEEYIIESDLNFTILQPSDFMLPLYLQSAFHNGTFELSWDLNKRQSMIDVNDLTDAVVKIVGEREVHFGASYELSAPGAHSAHDIGKAIAKATDRPIEVTQIAPDSFLRTFFGEVAVNGDIRYQADVFRTIAFWYTHHDFVCNSNVLSWLLCRPPTTLAEFVAREWETYSRTGRVTT